MIKRFAVTGITRDREYNLTKGAKGSRILYFSANPNGEAETVKVILKPKLRQKTLVFEKDFSTIMIKGRGSIGNILTKAEIHKISLKQKGSSTLGGRPVWFDHDILRLNYDGRGEELGEFQPDDLILVILTNGDFYTTNFELSNHFEANILLIERFDAAKTWTAVLYDADQQYPYLKRFQLEVSSKKQNFLGDNANSALHLLTDETFARIEIVFGGNDSFREPLIIEAEQFVGVKSFKAKGKRISTFEIANVNELDPAQPEHQPSDNDEETPKVVEDTELQLDTQDDTHNDMSDDIPASTKTKTVKQRSLFDDDQM
jgi:topoisomerase-4 subunit A